MRLPKLQKHHVKFLSPSPIKFLWAAALFALTSFLSPLIYGYLILNAHLKGLPLPFVFQEIGCTTLANTACPITFFWFYLIIDIAFWYLMACIIIHLGKVIKKG